MYCCIFHIHMPRYLGQETAKGTFAFSVSRCHLFKYVLKGSKRHPASC